MTGADDRLRTIRGEISALLGEYVGIRRTEDDAPTEFGDIVTEWVAVVGATCIDWSDGQQTLLTIHPDVPYTARLGLLTSAQHDLVNA